VSGRNASSDRRSSWSRPPCHSQDLLNWRAHCVSTRPMPASVLWLQATPVEAIPVGGSIPQRAPRPAKSRLTHLERTGSASGSRRHRKCFGVARFEASYACRLRMLAPDGGDRVVLAVPRVVTRPTVTISKLRLRGFKCFSDSEEFDINPLTLIFGRNNSGKSSILQSLLLLKQSLDLVENEPRLNLRGPFTQPAPIRILYSIIARKHQCSLTFASPH